MAIEIDKTYFYKLHMLKSASDTFFDQSLSLNIGVSLPHFALLATVYKFQPVSQQKIAEFLDISAGAISRQLDVIQEFDWVSVGNDKKDRRKQLVSLTPAGEKIFLAGDAHLREIGPRIFGSREEIYQFTDQIDTLQKRIDELSPKE